MKKSDLFQPIIPFKRNYQVYNIKRPRGRPSEQFRDFYYAPAKINFSQFDSEKYDNNGFSKN